MPEDNKGGDPQAKPAGEMPKGSDDGKNASTDSLQAELAEVRKALKAANSEAADRRKKLQAFEDAEKKRKESEMSEVEKLNAQLVEMTSTQEQLQKSLQDTKLNAAIDVAAKTLNFINVDEARAHINRDALKLDDEGNWTGVKKALETLAEERPHFIEKKTPMPNTDGKKRNTSKATTQDEAYMNTIRSRYSIRG